MDKTKTQGRRRTNVNHVVTIGSETKQKWSQQVREWEEGPQAVHLAKKGNTV